MRSLLGNEFFFCTNCTDDRKRRQWTILKVMIDHSVRFGAINLNPTAPTVAFSSRLHSHSISEFKGVNTFHDMNSSLFIAATLSTAS
jgi:hypothetical protein